MTQAIKSVADYTIQDLKMHRVFAEPYSNNPASARVLEKAGILYEGVLRSSVLKMVKSSISSSTASLEKRAHNKANSADAKSRAAA